MKNNPYIALLRQMWHYAPNKNLVVGTMLALLISKIIWLLEPFVMGQLINTIQLDGFTGRNTILRLLIALAGITLVSRLFHGPARIGERTMQFGVSQAFVQDMFARVAALPIQRHSDHHSGTTIDKINKAKRALKEFSGNNFMYIGTITNAIGALVSLTLIWRPATVLLLGVSLVTFVVVWIFDKKIVALIKRKNKKDHLVMSTLFDFLSNIKTVITLRFESQALQTLSKKINDVRPPYHQESLTNEWKWFYMNMLMSSATVLILGWYMWTQFSGSGAILIGTFTMLFQYTQKMKYAFDSFTRQYSDIVRKHADLSLVAPICDAYDGLSQDYQAGELAEWSRITIRDLSFRYQDKQDRPHTLQNVNLDLAPGKRIALVGASGSGKSTLMSLLRGLYDVDHVQVDIDNTTHDHLHVLSHLSTLIPQEPEIFENTIRYNISMGLDIDEDTIMTYTDMACFTPVLAELADGLATDIKEKGVNLSGGQKQRLALARGLLMARNSDIILLDEPTSSVDSVNEKHIYTNIFGHFSDTCIISSIHKLHLLELFDHIYVLDDGHIVEQGSFHELCARQGALRSMWQEYQLQAHIS